MEVGAREGGWRLDFGPGTVPGTVRSVRVDFFFKYKCSSTLFCLARRCPRANFKFKKKSDELRNSFRRRPKIDTFDDVD